ncbi:hypothetical protein PFICI_07469 [Pestalotiopsis fici W106-1]|uniref:Uncharacterized protein n=1 Tax=Pestalotiopsis fici (strain W106-1 / CGMCC3.15140) TaxID=1229662 RepID=W3X1I5_PESFW|nr:uncharacterized protein PFICI_07469 [Pestalotiopsis fici W106-1]ETS79940.1 hypothetical protein PFICI_07469 [Pestalotiopsis fici W106-1]
MYSLSSSSIRLIRSADAATLAVYENQRVLAAQLKHVIKTQERLPIFLEQTWNKFRGSGGGSLSFSSADAGAKPKKDDVDIDDSVDATHRDVATASNALKSDHIVALMEVYEDFIKKKNNVYITRECPPQPNRGWFARVTSTRRPRSPFNSRDRRCGRTPTGLPDPERGLRKAENLRTIKAPTPSPTSYDHLIFSIPHRLLTIALRRGILVDYSSLDDLLNSDDHQIRIKRAAFDQPVIRGSVPRGLGVSEDPVSAHSLTEYLKLRGQWLGYEESITYTSIRRRSATELSLSIGRDDVRAVMNHEPDSRILEKYYLNGTGFRDMTALGLGIRGTEGDQSEVLAQQNHPLAIGAISHNAEDMIQLHGPALNATLGKLMVTHGPLKGTEREKKLTMKRLRYAAKKTLLSEESQRLCETMSRVEHARRVQTLAQSKFMDQVLEMARQAMKDSEAQCEAQVDDAEDPLVDHTTGLFKESDACEEEAEEDFEDQVTDENGTVVKRIEEIEEQEASLDENPLLTYEAATRSFMEVILFGTMSKNRDWKNNPVQCQLFLLFNTNNFIGNLPAVPDSFLISTLKT